jgi:hypothetical protein
MWGRVSLIDTLPPHMDRLRPVPAARHTSPATFVHKDLHNCTHVFLSQDATRRTLEPPYSGPHKVLSRREKTLQILVRGTPLTVSTDRVKPACIFNEADFRNTVYNPALTATPHLPPPSTTHPPKPTSLPHPPTRTTRSGRYVHIPAHFSP